MPLPAFLRSHSPPLGWAFLLGACPRVSILSLVATVSFDRPPCSFCGSAPGLQGVSPVGGIPTVTPARGPCQAVSGLVPGSVLRDHAGSCARQVPSLLCHRPGPGLASLCAAVENLPVPWPRDSSRCEHSGADDPVRPPPVCSWALVQCLRDVFFPVNCGLRELSGVLERQTLPDMSHRKSFFLKSCFLCAGLSCPGAWSPLPRRLCRVVTGKQGARFLVPGGMLALQLQRRAGGRDRELLPAASTGREPAPAGSSHAASSTRPTARVCVCVCLSLSVTV